MNPIALLTQHDKARAIGPALEAAHFAVFTVDGFDTDTLGTFTGETARRGSQLHAAVAKAKKACEMSGERYGLGSEGSFGPDPYAGIAAWAIELLVWSHPLPERCVHNAVYQPLRCAPSASSVGFATSPWKKSCKQRCHRPAVSAAIPSFIARMDYRDGFELA